MPLGSVIETMRPLAIEPIAGAPAFVMGLSIIRGAPVPVIDLGGLLGGASAGGSPAAPGRLVTLRVDGRCVALAVEAVLGVRALPASLEEPPPLLREAADDAIESIGVLDAELLLVLRAAQLVPESVWTSVGAAALDPGDPAS